MSFGKEERRAGRSVAVDALLVLGTGGVTFLVASGVEAVAAALGRARQDVPLEALLVALVAALLAGAVLAVRRGRAYRAAAVRLRDAKEQAEARDRRRAAFLSNISHEIRTPLAGIIGLATVLEEELPEEKREFAQIIKSSGERLVETLNSILDLSRLEAGAVAVRLEWIDVGAEVEEVMRLFQPVAEGKGLRLAVDVPPGQVRAWLDAAFLHRILANLISNAVKFTEAGQVEVRVTERDAAVQIEVRDTGAGIREDFLPRLFEEFAQEDAGLSRTHSGSGLGLAITRHLVELMHGSIAVESRKGEGSTFFLLFRRSPGETAVTESPVLPSRQAVPAGRSAP